MSRFARRRDTPAGPTATSTSRPTLLQGDEPYEVTCDPAQQDALWKATGVRRGTPVMLEIRATLVPEWIRGTPSISVHIADRRIGALAPDDSAALIDGLRNVMERNHTDVAVRGRVVSGATTPNGDKRQLIVWVYLDPIDFGFDPPALEAVRTGHSVAADDRWAEALPADHVERVKFLRQQLDNENAPLQRHLMYNSLEEALFRIRDSGPLAFDEFEAAVAAHDAEMPAILPALFQEFGGVPELPAYPRLARLLARRHRVGDALRWATRGLELYGQHGTNAAAVDDLRNWAAVFSRAAGRPEPTNASMLAAPTYLTPDFAELAHRSPATPARVTPAPEPINRRDVVEPIPPARIGEHPEDARDRTATDADDEAADTDTGDDAEDDPVEATAAAAPPAWYPDPTGRASMRFWDGARWTQHVSTDGTTGVDHLD